MGAHPSTTAGKAGDPSTQWYDEKTAKEIFGEVTDSATFAAAAKEKDGKHCVTRAQVDHFLASHDDVVEFTVNHYGASMKTVKIYSHLDHTMKHIMEKTLGSHTYDFVGKQMRRDAKGYQDNTWMGNRRNCLICHKPGGQVTKPEDLPDGVPNREHQLGKFMMTDPGIVYAADTRTNPRGTHNDENLRAFLEKMKTDMKLDDGATPQVVANTLWWVFHGESDFACDRRLKENIVRVGTSPSGIPEYTWNYIDDATGTRFHGPMAQDLLALGRGDAVSLRAGGWYHVDASKIDVAVYAVE